MKGGRCRLPERGGGVRLGVTCAKEIRPAHSILTDRPGEGSAQPPRHTHMHTPARTHLPPSLSAAAITLFWRPSLSLHLYLPLHHPPLPPLSLHRVFSFLSLPSFLILTSSSSHFRSRQPLVLSCLSSPRRCFTACQRLVAHVVFWSKFPSAF